MIVQKKKFREYGIDKLAFNANLKILNDEVLKKATVGFFGCSSRRYIKPKKRPKRKNFKYCLEFKQHASDRKSFFIYWRPYFSDSNPILYDSLIQFHPHRGDRWLVEEQLEIIEKLQQIFSFDLSNLLIIEYYFDLKSLPKSYGYDFVFGQRNARTLPSRSYKGIIEGKVSSGRGVATKFYFKSEVWDGFRLEVVLSRKRLIEFYGCVSIEDALKLSPRKILAHEARLCLVHKQAWLNIAYSDSKRSNYIRKLFREKGYVYLRNKELTKAEKKRFVYYRKFIPASHVFKFPREGWH